MIDFDISGLIPESLAEFFSAEMVDRLLDDLADGARAKWIALARRDLRSTREDYIRGIQPVEVKDGVRVVTLVGWLANAVEQGLGAFDLRETLLGPGSRIRRVSEATTEQLKSGRGGSYYAYVPFRHGTPGSAGQVGSPMGQQYGPRGDASRGLGGLMEGSAAAAMGTRIYQEAKRLKASVTRQPGAATKWGGRLGAGLAPKLAEHHKTDIFAGMVRSRHLYERATQTQYTTWRTISTRVTTGWRHPGIEARGLARSVEDWLRETAPRAIAAMVRGIGK